MKYRTGDCVRELENISQSDDGLYDPCKYYNFIVGGNSRLDSMQAAVLNVKLGTLGKKNKRRADIAGMYKEGLEGLPVVIPQKVDSEHISCWHQFAILVDEKDMFAEYLKSKGIGTGAFYPVPLHLQKVFLNLGYQKGNLPVAESVCDRSVCLPIFPELSDDEVKYIIGTIRDYFR
jgi:dTDP-4-amino-4,6-dideoxygalactose transaminase